MDTPIDYAALGFRFTVADAAEVLSCTDAEVLDLIRSRTLAYLTLRVSDGPVPKMCVRLHPGEVARYLAARKRGEETSDARAALRVQRLLRDYVRSMPPTSDYYEAREFGCPLLGRSFRGDRVHIEVRALLAFNEQRHVGEALSELSVTTALRAIGALPMRGVIPASEKGGRQRWGKWWRIPLSVAGADEEETTREVLDGVRSGDEVVLRRDGEVMIKGDLGVD